MIVGLNYDSYGSRYINTIVYSGDWNALKKEKVAQALTQDCDEVYITEFDEECEDFINEIVLKGCRIGV
jgi:hypothetical protein